MMKYVDEYRQAAPIRTIVELLREEAKSSQTFMEVCGGHTMAINRFGLHSLLPDPISLISGPGCPVCVTDQSYINRAIALARREDVIVTTFGDLIRVPGSSSSLEREKSRGADVRIVYSSLEALDIAEDNDEKKVVFLGIGFETTAPTSAATVLEACKRGLSNFFLYSAHKLMPPAMEALAGEDIGLDGYLCPGQVSTITGTDMYLPLARDYGLSCVVSGFEPADIMRSLLMLVRQRESGRAEVENEYTRVVRQEGNQKAKGLMERVFTPRADLWRGLGRLEGSGLKLREEFSRYDAEACIEVEPEETRDEPGCICAEVLKGLKTPLDCLLFADSCSPTHPVGACMVSNEGACAAYYRYRRTEVVR
jgi:hydrogenase expression/formation protein HypD